jgi:hypothetical protein
MIELGKEAFDEATGFVGIVVAHAHYLGGYRKCLLAGKSKDGKAGVEVWFDANRVIVTPEGEELGNGFGYSSRGKQW